MNLSRFFPIQKKLDERIVKEKGLEGQDLLPEKILALQVELGELANEWRGFKFWSAYRESNKFEWCGDCEVCYGEGVDDENHTCANCAGTGDGHRNPLLEEYVDCLHFILSIGLEIGDTVFDMGDYEIHFEGEVEVDLTEQFISTNWLAGCLIENSIHYEQTLFNVLKLGEMLGFTWDQIETAYFEKNKINHARQENGY